MLYIVGTPIGNLSDLSSAQIAAIFTADILLAEDTRSAGILLQKITASSGYPRNQAQRTISYYKEKEFEKLAEVISWLKEGKKVVLISESGLPLMSDPGLLLVRQMIRENQPFTVVPGPSAVTTALLYSGFDPTRHMFLGFLPKKEGELRHLLEKVEGALKLLPKTAVVFFESPLRIRATLAVFNELLPGAKIAVCREMTKKFEEIIRGQAKDLMNRDYRGEITVVFTLDK